MRASNYRISMLTSHLMISYVEYLSNGILWLVSCFCHMQIYCVSPDRVLLVGFQNSFLCMHNTSVFGHIGAVPTLFKVFACAEHFETGKSRRCYSTFSSFCNCNRNHEHHCTAFQRNSSAYLQITIFKISSWSVKESALEVKMLAKFLYNPSVYSLCEENYLLIQTPVLIIFHKRNA